MLTNHDISKRAARMFLELMGTEVFVEFENHILNPYIEGDEEAPKRTEVLNALTELVDQHIDAYFYETAEPDDEELDEDEAAYDEEDEDDLDAPLASDTPERKAQKLEKIQATLAELRKELEAQGIDCDELLSQSNAGESDESLRNNPPRK